jgi:hypothetical protein
MASSTTHLIELIINATNNAGAGFAAARRDAQKFNDLINQGEKDTDKSAEAQDRLQKAIEVSNKKMKEENDSLGENIALTEKDAAAKATLTSAIKNQAAEIASGEATKDSLFLADQRRDQAEDALAESRRKRRATEIRSEEAFVAKFGELGSRKNIQNLEASLEEAQIEVNSAARRRDARREEIRAEEQHVKTLDSLIKKAKAGNFRGNKNSARTVYAGLRPALTEAGFGDIDVSGSDQTFLRTLKNARKAAAGRVTKAQSGTLKGVARPNVSEDQMYQEAGTAIDSKNAILGKLQDAQTTRKRDTVDEARFIDEIIAKEEGRAALEIDRFAREQEHQALLVEGERLLEGFDRKKSERASQRAKDGSKIQGLLRDEESDRKRILDQIEKLSTSSAKYGALTSRANKDLRKQISLLRQEYIELGNDEEREIRRREVFGLIRIASQKALGAEMAADLERQQKEKIKIYEKEIALGERLTKELEKEQARQIALGEKLTSELEKEQAKRGDNTYKKASEIRERSRRLASDRSKLRTEGQEDDLALKAKLEVDRLEINKLKEELRAELGDLEIKVKANPDAISIAKIEAIKAILGKDINVDIEFDEKISPLKFAKEAFGAFSDGAERASRSVSSFDNVFRGLLVLGIVAFLGQLATGIILAASALTALVSSALSAAGALGGALVAGIGQALPAVGVLAAFGNRVSNVFDALKQSNLEQQQASYSGAEAADTQAKSLSGVADAQKALTEARKTAKKALEDLIFAEKGQALSAEEAGFALKKAISSGGSMEVARAQLGVEGANRDLAGTRSEISSRRKSGIEGSPEVVAAQKSLDQALQSANQGTASVGAAAGKLNYLVENLSKAEQRLLKALIRLQTAWRKFAENITEPLTNSFTFAVNKVIKILDSKQILNAGKRLSTALGASFTQIFDALFSKNTVTRFLALGEEFAKNLKPITSIAIRLLNIFLNFAEAGGPALSLILGYLNDIVGALDRWSSSIAGKKSLTDFFTEGSGSLKGILDLLMAIGNVILAIMGPGGGIKAGNEIIQQMVDGLNKFAEAIKDPTSRVGIFFKNFFDQGKKLLPILGPIFSALGTLVEALISPRATKAFENFSHIVANAVIPGIEKFIALSTLAFNVFSFFAKTGLGEFIIKWGIAGALIGGVASKVVAITAPFTSLAGYLTTATGQLTLFNKELKITNALTAVSDLSGRGAAKNSLKKGKSVAVDAAPGKATAAEYGAALAANEAFDAAKGTSQRRSQKARDKALGKLGDGREDDIDKARKQANKIDKIGDKAGLAQAGSLLTKLANPAGLVVIAVAAITALIVGLIAYSGRLGDVWKQIKKTFNEVFAELKKGAGQIAKEITGKNSVKEAFDKISSVLKKVGNALADVVIWMAKAYGDYAKNMIKGWIWVIIAAIKYVKFVIQAFKDVKHWIKEAGKDINTFFTGIWDGILTGLETVINKVLGAIKKMADAYNKLPIALITGKIDTSGLGPVNIETSKEKAATKKAADAKAAKEPQANTPKASGEQKYGKEDQQNRRGITPDKAEKARAKSGSKTKAATKVDNQDANAFLNTFDPQTVQLSDAIVKKLSSYWRTLRRAARDSVNDVIDFLKDLRGAQGNGRVDKFATAAISDFKRLRSGVRVNMTGISNIVKNQMQNSMEAVRDAAVYMKKTLNDALKAVGADSLSITIGAPPKITGEPQKVATGGWIGNRGERGKDEVHTILGRGEAVLNWGQQKVVEPALRQVYGFGLDEMFGRTRGLHAGMGRAKNKFAKGGRVKPGIYTASMFGDPSNNDDNGIGYRGDIHHQKPDTWAELGGAGGVGTALGGLPYMTPIVVNFKGKSMKLYKRDIGGGGPGLNGNIRAIDIWYEAARRLGFSGLQDIRVNGAKGGSSSESEKLKMPKITGADSAIGNFVSKGTKKMIAGAQKYLDKNTPETLTANASGGDGGQTSSTGLVPQVLRALAWARSHGWTGAISEGFRTYAKQKYFWDLYKSGKGNLAAEPGTSNHEKGQAVDITDPGGFARAMRSAPRNARLFANVPGENWHYSVTGNAAGGFVGLKQFADGGHISGPDGKAVPIVAHAGEWVVNKMQQAKLAMMAGTTPEKVKNALGFGGGPTSFAKGGEVGVLDIPKSLTESSSTGTFTSEIAKAISFLRKSIKDVLSFGEVKKEIKKAEAEISKLQKGSEDAKQKKEIKDLEDKVKALKGKKFNTNIDNLIKSVRQLTDEAGGALTLLAAKIDKDIAAISRTTKLAATGLKAIATGGFKRLSVAELTAAIDPVAIAKAEEALQAGLSEKLRKLRINYVSVLNRLTEAAKKVPTQKKSEDTISKAEKRLEVLKEGSENAKQKKEIKNLEKAISESKKKLEARGKLDAELNTTRTKIGEIEDRIIEAETAKLEAQKTAFEEGTKAATKTQDAAIKQSAYLKSVGELLSSFGGSLFGQTGQDLVTKSLADNKQAAIDRQGKLVARLEKAKADAAADPRLQSLADDLADQVNEANLAVLQAMADEGANAITVLQKGIEDKIKAIDTKAALENVSKSIGELIGDNEMVANALNQNLANANNKKSALEAALAEATAKDQSDPRWKELTDSLRQQVADAGLSVYEANAAIIQNAVDATEKVFQRGEFLRGISERGAALAERIGNRSGAFATRQSNLAGRGADLQSQRDSLQALLSNPAIAGNAKQIEELANKIKELDMSIAENSQETKDLSLEYRKSQIDLITGRSDRTTGLIGSVGGIIANIARATGSSQSLESQIGLAQQIKAALGLEQGGLADQISDAIADQQLGSEANAVLAQLQTAFSSGDPASFAATLAALSPTIAELDSTLGATAAGTFQSLINAMITNTTATTDNTANLAELNGLANQPQQFATTAWTKFRTALFNGVGDILPQFQIPQMATGGYITKGGMFELHPGEFVVNASQSNLPSDSPINITVNEANKPLDVTALASRIAFEKRTRR